MPIDDMSDVIAELSSGTYTVNRYGPAAFVGGRAQTPASSQFTIVASVQPVRGRELERLSELYRTTELLACFTATRLRTVSEEGETDEVVVDDVPYAVQSVEDWSKLGSFWKAIIVRTGH